MANLNVSSPAGFVTLNLTTQTNAFSITGSTASWSATTASVITVPALQDITVTNSNGTFRWVQMDNTSRFVVATPATNSLNFNIVLDQTSFYTGAGSTPGIFNLSNLKSRVYFQFYWGGVDSSTGAANSRYIVGSGFVTGLAPKATPDQPVWMSPLVIEVDGSYYPNSLS